MNKNQENWINGVFDSLEGSQRAKPSKHLFDNIEGQLLGNQPTLFSRFQKRIALAAAVVLLVLNVVAIQQMVSWESRSFVNESDGGELLNSSYLPSITEFEIFD